MALRLAFMGTPLFAVATLDALVGAGHAIQAVYTQPPRPAGRGKTLRPSPVQARAEALGLPARTPKMLKDPDEQAAFAALALDAAVVVAYGLILPKPILEAPRFGCLNVHASILPRWRGAAPIHRAVMAGDAETGVSIMAMDAGLDTGPVLREGRVPIGPRATTGSLHDALAALGARLMVETLDDLARGRAKPTPQASEGATYARKIEAAEEKIDWNRPAAEIDRLIRALSPAPGAHFDWGGERIKVLEAEPARGSGAPGATLDDALLVACGAGALRLLKLQRPGKAAMAAGDFLRGRAIPVDARLG